MKPMSRLPIVLAVFVLVVSFAQACSAQGAQDETAAVSSPAAVPAAAPARRTLDYRAMVDGSDEDLGLVFTDAKAQAAEFIRYFDTIELTPEQERVKAEALTPLPAPCCADHPLLTCCCPCNMAKAVWGLSAHLIAERGFDAEQVRKAAVQWLEFSNPDGFIGDACYTGGCGRSFDHDGCGGMSQNQIL